VIQHWVPTVFEETTWNVKRTPSAAETFHVSVVLHKFTIDIDIDIDIDGEYLDSGREIAALLCSSV